MKKILILLSSNIKEFSKNIQKGKIFSTLRSKLILSFLVPIICIVILGTVSFNQAGTAIRDNYEKSLGQALNMTGEYLSLGLSAAEDTAIQYINDSNILRYFSNYYNNDTTEVVKGISDINSSFISKAMTDKFIGNIYALSDNVQSISTSKIDENQIYDEFLLTDWGKYVSENKRKTLWLGKDEYLDKKLGTSSNSYALRLIRHFNDVDGILVIDIKTDEIKKTLNNLEFGEGSILAFISSDKKELISDKSIISDELIFVNQDFYQEAFSSDQINGSKYVNYNDKPYLFMYYKIGDSNAMLCSLIPKNIITSQANGIKHVTGVIVIFASIIAVSSGLFISHGIDSTLKKIISKLKDAAKGDLTVSFQTKGAKEFKNLTEEIQNTFANMKNLIGHVKALSSSVSASSLNVDQTSELFLKSSTDISASMIEIENGIMQQAKDAEESLLQMDNLSNKIIKVSNNTKEISFITDTTKKSVVEGTKTTDRLNQQSKSTIEITIDIINKIENLASDSGSIGKIIDTINEIADQTNLLSLNASIEAARAGDAGRGFAVVADEIRKLAEKSKASVYEIKKIIDKIQNNTESTVQTAKQVEKVMMLQDEAVKNTLDSFEEINNNVSDLVIYLKEIADNVDNMDGARSSTLGAIESISAVMEEIAASTNTVNQTATVQLNAAQNMNEFAGNLRKHADELLKEVEKFRV